MTANLNIKENPVEQAHVRSSETVSATYSSQEEILAPNAVMEEATQTKANIDAPAANIAVPKPSSQLVRPLPKLGHISNSRKINLMRQALLAGMGREEICSEGQISPLVFDRLYFSLCQLDKKYYEVEHKSHFLHGKVHEKGFYTSMDRIGALGLEGIFYKGAEIKYSKLDNKILIEVIKQVQLPASFEEPEENDYAESADVLDEAAIDDEELEWEEERLADEDFSDTPDGQDLFDEAGA